MKTEIEKMNLNKEETTMMKAEIEKLKTEKNYYKAENEQLKTFVKHLEKELEEYNKKRKKEIYDTMNEFEKTFIAFLKEEQEEWGFEDWEMAKFKLFENGYNYLLKEFLEQKAKEIDESKIKEFFNFNKYTNKEEINHDEKDN